MILRNKTGDCEEKKHVGCRLTTNVRVQRGLQLMQQGPTAAVLLRRPASSDIRPVPNSHTAAGTGTEAIETTPVMVLLVENNELNVPLLLTPSKAFTKFKNPELKPANHRFSPTEPPVKRLFCTAQPPVNWV